MKDTLFPFPNIQKSELIKIRPKRKEFNQYFTPQNCISKALSLIPDKNIQTIIDPAVGKGDFLKSAKKLWTNAQIFGIDVDKNLSEKNQLFRFYCADSIQSAVWHKPFLKNILNAGGFDLTVGNPPYSSWFDRIENKDLLSKYRIINGFRSVGIEILFIELFIKITKENGYIVIVLPDGILGNPQNKFVRDFILKHTQILHIINLPRNIFSDTSAKTSILILKKIERIDKNYRLNIHDLETNLTFLRELKNIQTRFDYNYLINNESANKINFDSKPLGDYIVEMKTGKTRYGKERMFAKKGLRFLHATNITDIGINYKKDERFIDSNTTMFHPSALTQVNDILFVRVGVGCSGRATIVDSEKNIGVATDYIFIIRTKEINPFYLTLYLKSKIAQEHINKMKHGVGTVSVNKKEVMSIPIALIPPNTQNAFGEKYKLLLKEYSQKIEQKKTIEQVKGELKKLLSELENFFTKNFNGEQN